MIKVVITFVFALMVSTTAWAGNWNQSKIEVSKPEFTKYFYGETVGEKDCLNGPVPAHRLKIRSNEDAIKIISSVIGFDWVTEHAKNSNSLSVKHEKISIPARELFALTQRAIFLNDEALKSKSKQLILEIARSKTLMETPSLAEVKSKGGLCYGGKNDTKAVCKFHVPLFAMQFGANYLIAASLLKTDMSDDERNTVTEYADKLYKKFSLPMFVEMHIQKKQFSQMANGGIALLAYAFWKDDPKLAQDTFGKIFTNIDRVFLDDGYIKGSSFRGVRGFWYHSYGTNSALAVLALADLWQIKAPDKVRSKVKNAASLLNVGIKNIDDFYARPSPDGKQYNASYDEKDARHHVHQMAIGIAHLAKIAVDVDVNIRDDSGYKRKTPSEYPSDFTIGFNSNCMSPKP